MSLGAESRLNAPAEKDLTIGLNCSGIQRHGVTLTVQSSEKACLTIKKDCHSKLFLIAFPR